jgi:hypothetical protein
LRVTHRLRVTYHAFAPRFHKRLRKTLAHYARTTAMHEHVIETSNMQNNVFKNPENLFFKNALNSKRFFFRNALYNAIFKNYPSF